VFYLPNGNTILQKQTILRLAALFRISVFVSFWIQPLPFEIAVGDYEASFVDLVFEGRFFVNGFYLGIQGVFLYFFVFRPSRD
jgi:hypothetical protein